MYYSTNCPPPVTNSNSMINPWKTGSLVLNVWHSRMLNDT